ncbi:MAG: hypothetical protein IPO93_05165 [Actinobacteria bacterium]|nr:hypothetical protein [Actinomycetota bacterium]
MSQVMTDLLSRGGASIVGFLLVLATTISLMRTVVIPRALHSLISDTVSKVVTSTALILSRMRRTYAKRDGVLAWAGGTIIVLQLLTWLALYLVGYGLLIYGVSGMGMGDAMRESGSSLLTLGFASQNTEDQTIIDFLAAATGPIVIAMLIGFLPTIYSVYIEREVNVTMLGTAGGEPVWGPEMLARYSLADAVDDLEDTFAEWSRWAAALRMTHVTYPVLVWVRSARASRHYITSLLAVMDAAALMLSLNSSRKHPKAFTMLLQGGQALEVMYVFLFRKAPWRDRRLFAGMFTDRSPELQGLSEAMPVWNKRMMATELASDADAAQGLDADAVAALERGDIHPLSITRADFDEAVEMLRRAHFPIDRDLDDAWDHFRVMRSRYEFPAYQIAYRLDATPTPWSGDRRIPTPVAWPTPAVTLIPRHSSTDDPEAAGA